MNYRWAIGMISTRGKIGKSIEEHIAAGIGYLRLDEAPGTITYAFKFALDRPIPDHLRFATEYEALKLEQRAAF